MGTWLGHSDHLKDERLDLDGIWSLAQRLGSPVPSPFTLPLWPFELPARHRAPVQTVCGGISMVPLQRDGRCAKPMGQTLGVSSSEPMPRPQGTTSLGATSAFSPSQLQFVEASS